ncbi:protein-glutamate methylesterase/protein-glutamine glutaminase [Spirochaeta cellobiosiphila]|uniref:protein-glutamate methylesterase/protein-glutamine glutaminase n=1 Tax=Spirochaeta cellobiosiphila TaxID=504483 RepID=UPI0004090345|nr:chemotaxis response regulator protein-glutamate methylesterase [Spirochaeta cellobiosiphila]
MSKKIRVLVTDDSALMRNLISKIVEGNDKLEVAGTAMNGRFALKKIDSLKPDIIVLDLEMPEMNGIEFLQERKRLGIKIPVVILSSIATKGARITMEALDLGASDFITKPSGSISEDIHVVGERLCNLLIAYGGNYIGVKMEATSEEIASVSSSYIPDKKKALMKDLGITMADRPQADKIARRKEPGVLEILGLGISTGGPNALRHMLPHLREDFPVPILIVQHMPAGFTEEFANSLNRICPLEVKEAQDGDVIKAGRILIAPGDKHLEVERMSFASIAKVRSGDAVNGHRPSVDVLFESIGKNYGNRAMGVIMTGMGKDGAREIGRIYREGGITIGQDEQSSIVYGMPKVAKELGHLDKVVSLDEMAETLNSLTSKYTKQ